MLFYSLQVGPTQTEYNTASQLASHASSASLRFTCSSVRFPAHVSVFLDMFTTRTCQQSQVIRTMKANVTPYVSNLFDKFCWHLLADSQQNQHDIYLLRVYSVEILLMIDSGHVRNMQSTLSNKSEKQCISLAFIIRIHHDAWSSECQNHRLPSLYIC